MPEVKPFPTPWEAVQAMIRDEAEALYGIRDADPIREAVKIAFMPTIATTDDEGRQVFTGPSYDTKLSALRTLLKYSRPEVRAVAIHVEGGVDVNHTHKAASAVEQAKALLGQILTQRLGDKVIAGEAVEVPAEPVDEPTKH